MLISQPIPGSQPGIDGSALRPPGQYYSWVVSAGAWCRIPVATHRCAQIACYGDMRMSSGRGSASRAVSAPVSAAGGTLVFARRRARLGCRSWGHRSVIGTIPGICRNSISNAWRARIASFMRLHLITPVPFSLITANRGGILSHSSVVWLWDFLPGMSRTPRVPQGDWCVLLPDRSGSSSSSSLFHESSEGHLYPSALAGR